MARSRDMVAVLDRLYRALYRSVLARMPERGRRQEPTR